jgi:hypothetical protein
MSPYLPHPTIVVANVPLAIELSDDLPAKCDARLDPDDNPRYIKVNRNLPQYMQVFGIGRECGFLLQQRGYNSLVLNRPWKWKLLAAAPDEIRQKLFHLDAEGRASWFMIFNAKRDHFRAFRKNQPKKFFRMMFAEMIFTFHLSKLRLQTWIFKFFYALALYEN